MPKALGLVETRGLVAAIEAADAMVKAANVRIAGKEQTNPALITIKVIGDVAAVKAAVEAGAEAAKRVGELVSVHVIAQPDEQLLALFPEIGDDYDEIEESSKFSSSESVIVEEIISSVEENHVSHTLSVSVEGNGVTEKVPSKQKKERKRKELISETDNLEQTQNDDSFGPLFGFKNDTLIRLREEALGKKSGTLPEPVVESNSDNQEPETAGEGEIQTLNVHQLRKLARDTENFPIRGRDISKATRQELLEHFIRIS